METVNILWTGGWDSTYRILKLSPNNIIIQPYYMKDKNRESESIELKTINIITEEIKRLNTTKCIIRELITIDVSDIIVDNEITDAYKYILKDDYFGSQYDWLARFAKNINNLELTIHQDDKAYAIIKKYGITKVIHSESKGDYHVLDHTKSPDFLIKVFGNFHFPLLYHTKLEMKKDAEKMALLIL